MHAPIIVLHGSSDSKAVMQPLADLLAPWGRAQALNLLGHGGRPPVAESSIPAMAADVIAQMDAQGIRRAFIAGFSLGGYLALYIARHYPDRVRGVATIATKVVLEPDTLAKWAYIANPERSATAPGVTAPTRAEELAKLHAPEDWRQVQAANGAMYRAMATNPAIVTGDLAAIQVPALVISGDADPVVTAEETRRIGEALRATTVVFPGPAHPIPLLPMQRIADIIGAWANGVVAGRRSPLASGAPRATH